MTLKTENYFDNCSKNCFIKNNVEFWIGKNTIVAFKDDGNLKLGSLVAFNGLFAEVDVYNTIFNGEMLFWDFIDEDVQRLDVPIQELLDYIGHVYHYGIELDMKNVIMFKNLF